MLPRYNIAACPTNPNDSDRLFQISSHFLSSSNGYRLSRGVALPHVTLCQFRSENNEAAVDAVRNYLSLEIDVSVSEIYVKQHVDSDGLWVGLNVLRGDNLLQTQSKIVGSLKSKSIETLVGVRDDYFPHFTLARILLGKVPLDLLLSDRALLSRTIPCRLKLGLSDENGQFIAVLAE
jgi:2'-5' RNA ligase